jgi:hypothetical protein
MQLQIVFEKQIPTNLTFFYYTTFIHSKEDVEKTFIHSQCRVGRRSQRLRYVMATVGMFGLGNKRGQIERHANVIPWFHWSLVYYSYVTYTSCCHVCG